MRTFTVTISKNIEKNVGLVGSIWNLRAAHLGLKQSSYESLVEIG